MTNISATRIRRRRRLKYLLIPLPVMIVLVVVAVKLVAPTAINAVGLRDFSIGDFGGSEEQSSRLLEENILEPYLPWFNRGNALAAQEEYTAAIDDFERALDLAPESTSCDVRVNLALSWERLGDIYLSGGYNQGAINLYEAAEAVIAEGGDCLPPEQAGEDLEAAGPRVQLKIDEAQRRKDAEDAQSGEAPGGLDEQLEDLDELGQLGAEEKANGDAAERGESGPPPDYTGKQW
jgi:tetratricopeptide (TPR) repeat protein